MFFDSFDIYLAGSVLGELVHSGWSTVPLNARFISATFVGMVIGAAGAGWLGDRYGRRFTYQFNLAIFGVGSLACAAAPDMGWLIAARFVTGIGLGAEIVIGYATMLEFMPPAYRGALGGAAVPGDQFRPVRLHPAELADHPGVRLAADVHAGRCRRFLRVVAAQCDAGIAALAGGHRARR